MVVRYRVKELAKAQKLTQFELAAKSGVSMTVVQRLWQNHRSLGDVRYSTLEAIANALGVQIGDLFAEGGPHGEIPIQGNREGLVAAAA